MSKNKTTSKKGTKEEVIPKEIEKEDLAIAVEADEVCNRVKAPKPIKTDEDLLREDIEGFFDGVEDINIGNALQKEHRKNFEEVMKELRSITPFEMWEANKDFLLWRFYDSARGGLNIIHYSHLKLPSGKICLVQEGYQKLSAYLNNIQLRSHVKSDGARFKLEISWMG